ncbi:MAG TPA: dihydropteroate synthase [Desulfohalobiaceae bacterium]|nr:dihydropteroate synthase [Desulfohalobiaceae bacterium]
MLREHTWAVRRGGVIGPAPFFVIGILNVTPDSFYDGGEYYDREDGIQRAINMFQQGADIVDIGGESTRPFSQPLDLNNELERILPVVSSLLDKDPGLCLSVDTYKAQVAQKALEAGVSIINDVSAYSFDPDLKDILVQYQPGYVLMHSQGKPENMQNAPRYKDIVQELLIFFEHHLNDLVRAGLPEENIVIDPGIGFGKTLEHNLTILQEIERLMVFGRPIYIGLSNKSMWEHLLALSTKMRKTASQVATSIMAGKGVCCHRVHEVEETIWTLTIVKRLT